VRAGQPLGPSPKFGDDQVIIYRAMRLFAGTLLVAMTLSAAVGATQTPAVDNQVNSPDASSYDRADRTRRIYGVILLVLGVGVFAADRKWPSKSGGGGMFSNRTVVTPALVLVGLWLGIVGRPIDAASGGEAAWGWIGALVAGGVGLLAGLIVSLRSD
jgi:hypothetical protein